MSYVISKKTDPDGWKAVTIDGQVKGHVAKVGDSWRARVGKTEHLGFKSQKDAAAKVEALAG